MQGAIKSWSVSGEARMHAVLQAEELARPIIMRLAARYLLQERRRRLSLVCGLPPEQPIAALPLYALRACLLLTSLARLHAPFQGLSSSACSLLRNSIFDWENQQLGVLS